MKNTPLKNKPLKSSFKSEKAKDDILDLLMSTPDAKVIVQEEYDRAMLAVFAKRLKEIRKAKGLTQIQLAKLMGVKQPEIARLESGESFAQVKTLFSFLRAIDGRFEIIY